MYFQPVWNPEKELKGLMGSGLYLRQQPAVESGEGIERILVLIVTAEPVMLWNPEKELKVASPLMPSTRAVIFVESGEGIERFSEPVASVRNSSSGIRRRN